MKKTGRPIPQAEPKVNPESHHNNDAEIEPLDPEEEQRVIAEAEEYKNEGNEIFKTAKSEDEFKRAIQLYERCLSICPEYLKHYRTNYWGNISACYSRLEKHKETVNACKKSLDLDALSSEYDSGAVWPMRKSILGHLLKNASTTWKS